MTMIPARAVRKGQSIVFHVANRRTVARVFRVEQEGDNRIVLCLHLSTPVPVPAMPGRKTEFWPLELAPDDPVELYV